MVLLGVVGTAGQMQAACTTIVITSEGRLHRFLLPRKRGGGTGKGWPCDAVGVEHTAAAVSGRSSVCDDRSGGSPGRGKTRMSRTVSPVRGCGWTNGAGRRK